LNGAHIFYFRRQYQEILIGDTHPEIIAIARELSKQSHIYKLFLPFYFTHKESRFIMKLFRENSNQITWLMKRTLPKEIMKSSLIRPFASLDLFLWVLKRLNLNGSSDKLLRIYKFLLETYLKVFLKFQPNPILICYDTIRLPSSIKNMVVVICPMTHPEKVSHDLQQAALDYPDWPFFKKNEATGFLSTSARADKLVLLSTYARDSFESAGFDSEKLFVLPIGPINRNLNSFEIRTRKIPQVLQVLFVGQMGLRKGVPALLELSYKINDIAKIRLVGPCSKEVARYIQEFSNSQTLTLVTNPTPQILMEEFKQAEIFVLPSYNEGFGIACVEGMSFGQIPVISRSTGVAEVLIGSGLERFLIRPGSAEDILANLEYIARLNENDFMSLRKESNRISNLLTLEKFSKNFVEKFC
jgi:glycosyltransferase involved in cell wall biosynthesis